jgi:hypothetical protein
METRMEVTLMLVTGRVTINVDALDPDIAKAKAKAWLNANKDAIPFMPTSYIVIVCKSDLVNDEQFDERLKKSNTDSLENLWENGPNSDPHQ